MNSNDTIASRMRDDDELIGLDRTRALMGDISVSTAYEDPELMALKISMTPPGRRTKRVRFIVREVLALRAQRAACSADNAPNVRAQTEVRVEQRRIRQRLRTAASAKA